MLGAFWDAVGGKLADRWATVTAPALVFWLAGLAAWTRHRGGLHTLSEQTDWLDRQSPAVQTAAILTVLLAVLASGILVARGATPVLRLLEGYCRLLHTSDAADEADSVHLGGGCIIKRTTGDDAYGSAD